MTRPESVRHLIGWNLRRLRVERGLSQEALALAAGIDRSYIGRVERGSENVTVATLEAFAEVLGIRVALLFAEPADGADPPPTLKAGRKLARSPRRGREATTVDAGSNTTPEE